MKDLSIGYEGEAERPLAEALANRLKLTIDNNAANQLLVTAEKLLLKIHPFLPVHADFTRAFWQKRRDAGKKQGLVRACKPIPGLRIIDATAGWGRDAAILASFGAEVLMLERNPVMAALLDDALTRCEPLLAGGLNLRCVHQSAFDFLQSLKAEEYPHLIFIDPMHPERQKMALVKKELQILQQLIGVDVDALSLIELARSRTLQKVVVKWPQSLSPLLKPSTSINGKTVRFDIYMPCRTSIKK